MGPGLRRDDDLSGASSRTAAMTAPMGIFRGRGVALALIAPALAVVGLFFVAPLVMSGVVAFRGKGGEFTLEHFRKSFDYYTTERGDSRVDRIRCRRS